MYKNESQHSYNNSGYGFLLLSYPKFSFVKRDVLEFHFELMFQKGKLQILYEENHVKSVTDIFGK